MLENRNQAYGAVTDVNSVMPCKLSWSEPETPFGVNDKFKTADYGGGKRARSGA